MIARRALVVEDSPTSAALLSAELERIGWRVRCVDSAAHALALLRLDPGYELVVTDYDMPEMDGVELVRRIRSQPRLAAVAAVLVTGWATDEVRAEAYTAGVSAVLGKGEAFDRLGELLQAADGR